MRVPDIPLKTSIDIAHIRKASRIAEATLHALGKIIAPGISTSDLDRFSERLIRKSDGNPALREFNGFPGAICTSVNSIAAHGVPDGTVLSGGDLVTVDVIVECDGWHGDAAWTYAVGEIDGDARRLIRAAWQSMLAGIFSVRAGGSMGDIGAAIKATAGKFGCSVLEDFAGHGIGRCIHEEPVILHTGKAGNGLKITPGMVFTIEPVLCLGKPSFHILEDSWSCRLDDGSRAAQFEQTVAVFKNRTEILTYSGSRLRTCLDFPPEFA